MRSAAKSTLRSFRLTPWDPPGIHLQRTGLTARVKRRDLWGKTKKTRGNQPTTHPPSHYYLIVFGGCVALQRPGKVDCSGHFSLCPSLDRSLSLTLTWGGPSCVAMTSCLSFHAEDL